jgi:hypothetical protein
VEQVKKRNKEAKTKTHLGGMPNIMATTVAFQAPPAIWAVRTLMIHIISVVTVAARLHLIGAKHIHPGLPRTNQH